MYVCMYVGTPDEKAKLMFDMYDFDGSGTLTKEEFKTMLRFFMMNISHIHRVPKKTSPLQ